MKISQDIYNMMDRLGFTPEEKARVARVHKYSYIIDTLEHVEKYIQQTFPSFMFGVCVTVIITNQTSSALNLLAFIGTITLFIFIIFTGVLLFLEHKHTAMVKEMELLVESKKYGMVDQHVANLTDQIEKMNPYMPRKKPAEA